MDSRPGGKQEGAEWEKVVVKKMRGKGKRCTVDLFLNLAHDKRIL